MSSHIPRIGNHTTTQACAACKYQRRKCATDCLLAPYFPHDRQRQFLNAHKLFGVSNICKIVKDLSPADKDQAMRTIIIQSDVRANDPVGGCYRIICDLQRQIDYHKAELELVLQQLALCRAQAQQQQQSQFQMQESNSSNANTTTTLSPTPIFPGSDIGNQDPNDVLYDPVMQYYYAQSSPELDFALQENQQNQELNGIDNINGWGTQDSNVSPSSQSFYIDHKQSSSFIGDDCCDDQIKPILDINDVKFEEEDLVNVDRRQCVRPSTQLVISS